MNDVSRRTVLSFAALTPIALAAAGSAPRATAAVPGPARTFATPTAYNAVFHILPIDEKPSKARGLSLDGPRMDDLKARLMPNGDGPSIRVGWSTSIWYMGGIFPTDAGSVSESKGAADDYVWDSTLRTDHKLALSLSRNVPVLFHMNGGHWGGASPLMTYLGSDNARVEWDQNNTPKFQLAQAGNPNDHQFMCLSRKNTVYHGYKKRNLQQAITRLTSFDAANPGIVVGVSLDSETIHQDYANVYGDYNPLTIREWREWLTGTGIYAAGQPYAGQGRSPAYTSISDFNADMGTAFASFAAIDPPRAAADNRFWRAWSDWQRLVLKHHLQDMSDWIVQAGMPSNWVYSHEIGPAGFWDSVAEHPSIAALEDRGLGLTAYGADATRDDLYQFAQWNSPNWGIFELNAAAGPDTPASYADAYASVSTPWNRGAQVICPNAWADLGKANVYNIVGTPFETAIRDFVAANRTAVRPGQYLERYTGTLDQDNSAASFSLYTDIRRQYWRAQTFTLGASTLAQVDVWLYRYGNPTFDLNLWITTVDAAGRPAQCLAQWSALASTVSQNAGWVSMHPRLKGLTAGTRLAVVISSRYNADNGLADSYGWAYNDGGAYPSGKNWFSTDYGATWTTETPGRSLKFRTYA